MITQERLRALLRYDSETGKFFWKVKRWRKSPGDEAGYIRQGYCCIKIEQVKYFAHRLAWLYTTGKFPENTVDHIDGDTLNNRFYNLREATQKQQRQNSRSGQGVYQYGAKWTARIGRKHLGTFSTREKALEARVIAERNMYGEFAYSNRGQE